MWAVRLQSVQPVCPTGLTDSRTQPGSDRPVGPTIGPCKRPVTNINEKALRETQTLRAGYSKVELKNFAPPQTPLSGARDGQNLINWRWSLPLPIQIQFGENRCTQYRVIVVTDPQTYAARPPVANAQTHRQDRLQYTAPLSLARNIERKQATCKNTDVHNWTHSSWRDIEISYRMFVAYIFVSNSRFSQHNLLPPQGGNKMFFNCLSVFQQDHSKAIDQIFMKLYLLVGHNPWINSIDQILSDLDDTKNFSRSPVNQNTPSGRVLWLRHLSFFCVFKHSLELFIEYSTKLNVDVRSTIEPVDDSNGTSERSSSDFNTLEIFLTQITFAPKCAVSRIKFKCFTLHGLCR